MSKITMQDIADALHVSRITIWKAYNDKPGVSADLKNQIFEKAHELGYLKKPAGQETDSASLTTESTSPCTISVVVARPESSVFWMNIIHQIAKELDKLKINLMYTYLPSKINSEYCLPEILSGNTLGGIIVLNVYDFPLIQLLNELPLPKVFLDLTPAFDTSSLSGDLVLLEGKSKIQKITSSLLDMGIKDIGFIGDTEYAITNKERYEGFCTALTEREMKPNKAYCLTGKIGIYTYEEEIVEFLKNCNPLPKAFVCVSDFVASFVLKYISEHQQQVPDDIVITGFDGSSEYPGIIGRITTVQVHTKALGSRLVSQLLFRINNPESPIAITCLDTTIMPGDTAKAFD